MAAISINTTPSMRQTAAMQAIKCLHDLGREDLVTKLHIEWKTKFTSRMGDALYIETDKPMRQRIRRYIVDGIVCRLRFSIPLWFRATEEERRQTVIHEVCHLVAHHESILAGRTLSGAHGYEWKSVMRRAGVSPKRCHSVNNKGLSSRRRIPAKCNCKDHELTPLVAGRILNGMKYTCRGCKAVIVVSTDISQAQAKECGEAVAKDVLRKGRRPARRR